MSTQSDIMRLIAHELRTPLGIIQWHTEMLQSGDYGALTDDQIRVVGEIAQAHARIKQFMTEYFSFSQIRGDGPLLHLSSIDVGHECHLILADFVPLRLQRHLRLSGDYDRSSVTLTADPAILRLILHTLIGNAHKYTPDLGEIIVDIQTSSSECIISIANNGASITPEEQKHIYKCGHRTAHGRSVDPSGTGMGLYLMKSLVESSGGRTWFASHEGEYTTFFVLYPITGMIMK